MKNKIKNPHPDSQNNHFSFVSKTKKQQTYCILLRMLIGLINLRVSSIFLNFFEKGLSKFYSSNFDKYKKNGKKCKYYKN